MKKNEELEKFRESIKDLKESDFDGHTDFEKLTPAERLEWLAQLIYFKHLASQKES